MQEKELLIELEERIRYSFHDSGLLLQAITHSSYANERKINKIEDYERLEFLGDAVLELVSSEFLFRGNPSLPEGQLTKTRASMVCARYNAVLSSASVSFFSKAAVSRLFACV